jgi:hypothetical protein
MTLVFPARLAFPRMNGRLVYPTSAIACWTDGSDASVPPEPGYTMLEETIRKELESAVPRMLS